MRPDLGIPSLKRLLFLPDRLNPQANPDLRDQVLTINWRLLLSETERVLPTHWVE
jgi:hypothetical protein